ncbi:Uncharacterised protein [Mycobacteroides abscessus subsp. bolletii]|uniref:Uncharacterized protein n=1 Tax=Mycobacteroides abscessus subsp. bolletii TaxID=319705 RepID=A0A9Q7WJ62_9MYCO|nr:hypothetical protein [Mycobacteroides abscessus]SHT81266.1 Uncharacterised protein [Mycobacteroides abscessus subsp. bolletii]SHU04741.1 Uncharacterised protein [Mycobacteroides abscessus subsp. bolletii]SHX40533.1 Uncharacterised protein [Mycobacteroides abscessus subsp. bolletii]SKM31734.1 Uncharacterised protein [Mycobacteroides abscessus subsp. bolletii]SKN41684.1 Uncharacterised protein [Mycobacteroides abscessus subsp. bolletii]
MAAQTVAPAPESTTRWHTARAVLALPFTVAVLVPLVILYGTGIGVPSWMSDQMSITATVIGTLLIAAGSFLVTRTVAQFDQPGSRHVRSPLITGVVAILLGEAFAVNSVGLLIWTAVFVTMSAIYFSLVDEHGALKVRS